MSSSDETSKLQALERARARLEAALAADADWQTLRCTSAAGAATLDTRMLSNPLYRAWKNVTAAIAARRAERDPSAPDGASAAANGGERSRYDGRPVVAGAARTANGDLGAATAAEDAALPLVWAASEPEARVSFVARGAAPASPAAAGPKPDLPDAARRHSPSGNGEDAAARVEEAEVSVVSVDQRRHAGAVARLLRALHGEPERG